MVKFWVNKGMARAAKSRKRLNSRTLDLHNLRPNPGENIQEAVARSLDNFMVKLLSQTQGEVCIIVGKGIGSKSLIEGKNPLRYYTENYLTQLGYKWRNDFFGDSAQDGVINISLS